VLREMFLSSRGEALMMLEELCMHPVTTTSRGIDWTTS